MYISPWLPLLEYYYQHTIDNENIKKSQLSPPTSPVQSHPNSSTSSSSTSLSSLNVTNNENESQSQLQSISQNISSPISFTTSDPSKPRKRCKFFFLYTLIKYLFS